MGNYLKPPKGSGLSKSDESHRLKQPRGIKAARANKKVPRETSEETKVADDE